MGRDVQQPKLEGHLTSDTCTISSVVVAKDLDFSRKQIRENSIVRTALWWIRRDMRLTDNQALDAALSDAQHVIPVFILDPTILGSDRMALRRVAFLMDGLRQLDASLTARGSRLVVRRGRPTEQLSALVRESQAEAIYAEDDFSPYSRHRDAEVAESLPLRSVGGCVVFPPRAVTKSNGKPYVVFTPFSRAWKSLQLPRYADLLLAPAVISTPAHILGIPIPDTLHSNASPMFRAGENEARAQLSIFTGGESPPIYEYNCTRDRVDMAGTSQLSPYIHLGMLSPRECVVAALDARDRAPTEEAWKSADMWLNELIWREFYIHILYYFPIVLDESFRANLRWVNWENNPDVFSRWCQGMTGYPIVDAAMRALQHTGWMHNRARMIVASFLVKDLLIDWRWGERYFMQSLIDGDTASNNGGWQWTAGTGTDAAPYFRVFNPVLQGKRCDPQGTFVRYWVPELKDVNLRYVHAPWEMPVELQKQCGCIIGKDYPAPIINHKTARERVLAVYAEAKELYREREIQSTD